MGNVLRVSLAAAGLLMGVATAQAEIAGSANWLMAKYDVNGDERITQQEIATKKLKLFRQMDADRDGGVDFDEYENTDTAKRYALLKSRFIKLDSDHNGRVTEEEYSSYMGMFTSIDSNGDGTLTADEMQLAEQGELYVTRCLWMFCLRTTQDD